METKTANCGTRDVGLRLMQAQLEGQSDRAIILSYLVLLSVETFNILDKAHLHEGGKLTLVKFWTKNSEMRII